MKTVLEYPSKMYPVKGGNLFTSEQMAQMQTIGIRKINEQLKTATSAAKIKKLKNQLRDIKLFIMTHPDVKQHIPK